MILWRNIENYPFLSFYSDPRFAPLGGNLGSLLYGDVSVMACMTILSPETVSLVLCQCSITDMQVPPVPNQPKNADILAQNALKMQIEATIYQNFSRERSPEFSYQSGDTLSRASPSTGTLNVTEISCVSITCSHHRRLRCYLLQSYRQGLIQFFFSSADPDYH